jgi:alanyl-tRNA synthetase
MTAKELRQKYLDFFKSKGHAIIPSAPVVPENDPTTLFITAGMHPLVPYLSGEKHPNGARLTNSQKSIRTIDIDEVGDTTHHTFFEMLGNWSLGDYFKKDALEWSWEFLTSPEWLNLDKNRLACSVFQGDEDAPFDQEAYDIWKNIGMPEKRIARLPKKNNWWGPAGVTGPCGPDSEIFYWAGDPKQVPEGFNDDNAKWVEIWNDVFMQFNKKADGTYEKLSQQNVDTGMGLERTLAIINGLDDNYRTELFWPIIEKIEALSGKKYDDGEDAKRAMRIIADHIKAAVFIIADGVEPSNVQRGYVLRRLIRRAVRQGHLLGINDNFTAEIAKVVQNIYKDVYLETDNAKILNVLKKEENKFGETLKKSEKTEKENIEKLPKPTKEQLNYYNVILKQIAAQLGISDDELRKLSKEGISPSAISASAVAFNLESTRGFPHESLFEDLRNIKNWSEEDIKEASDVYSSFFFKKHQELSRTAAAGMFKGGLADAGEETKKLHTAAHLMLAALRQVLGEHVIQKGSNITGERLRFDFSHGEKMTAEQIKKVEDLVNEQIQKGLSVVCEEMDREEARKKGAMGIFESKYGEKVKVYSAGDFSKEICGGPHVQNTSELGHFKIVKEESSSAGVRRIKAILE